MLVPWLVSVTATPGITPFASRTAPRTPPVNCWAAAEPAAAADSRTHKTIHLKPVLIVILRVDSRFTIRNGRARTMKPGSRMTVAAKWGHCRSAVTNVQRQLHTFVTPLVMLIAFGFGATIRAANQAQAVFERGVTALHSFEYEDANDAFAEARRLDPGLVMAYWGGAMTYHQSLWGHEDVEAGRRVLAALGPTAAARLARASGARERGLLTAVEALFGAGDAAARRQRYADEMAHVYRQLPEDPDVASFYALALLGTMSRGLIGAADAHEGHSRSLAGSDTQAQ